MKEKKSSTAMRLEKRTAVQSLKGFKKY